MILAGCGSASVADNEVWNTEKVTSLGCPDNSWFGGRPGDGQATSCGVPGHHFEDREINDGSLYFEDKFTLAGNNGAIWHCKDGFVSGTNQGQYFCHAPN